MKIAVVAAFAAIVLVGCSGQTATPAPAPTVTVTQEAPVPVVPEVEEPPSNEQLFLTGIKSMNNPILDMATDAQLLDMGYSICEALEAGFSTDDIIAYMATEMAKEGMTSDVEAEAVGYLIGGADLALCPGAGSF